MILRVETTAPEQSLRGRIVDSRRPTDSGAVQWRGRHVFSERVDAMKRCILLLILLLAGCTGGPPAISPNDPPPHDIPGLVSLLAAAGLDPVAMDDISLVLRDGSLMVLVFLEDDGESLQAVLPYRGSRHGDRERRPGRRVWLRRWRPPADGPLEREPPFRTRLHRRGRRPGARERSSARAGRRPRRGRVMGDDRDGHGGGVPSRSLAVVDAACRTGQRVTAPAIRWKCRYSHHATTAER